MSNTVQPDGLPDSAEGCPTCGALPCDWVSDLRAQLAASQRAVVEARDALEGEMKTAFVAGCCAVLTWTHSGMPQDDLDEAAYDYVASRRALLPKEGGGS